MTLHRKYDLRIKKSPFGKGKTSIMKYALLLTLGTLIAAGVSDTVSARSTDKCDNLTGRDRSRCLMKERRDSTGSSSQTDTNTRSAPSPSVSRPSVPRSASPGSSSSPGATVNGNRVTISWSSVTGATEYDFGIRDMTSNQLVVDTRTTGTSYTSRIERGRSYRWNVRACNSAGCSAFSTPLHFQSEPANGTNASAQSSVGTIALPATFPLYNQHDASNMQLYTSSEWANTEDPAGGPRTKYTCLATVYTMIQHARGNFGYKLGGLWQNQPTWDNVVGAQGQGVGGIGSQKPLGSAETLFAEFRQGNPVILWGLRPNENEGDFGHFVLAIGTNSAGQIIVHDPSGGKRVTVDPQSWRVSGGSVLSKVQKYRTVRY